MNAIKRQALTIQETAALLGVSRRAAYYSVSSGEIPTVKIGSSKRVPVGWVREKVSELGGEFPEDLLATNWPRTGTRVKERDQFGPIPGKC